MAIRNRVEVLITCKDEGTPVLQRFAKDADKLVGGVVGLAFGAASAAVGGFMKAVNEASDTVTDNIMAVGSLASVMGSTFDVADKLNNKITKGLAEQAAALPGTTDDYVRVYRTISDDVADMSKELNGGKFSAEKFEKQVVQLTSKFTALKGSASIAETIQGLQAVLGGRSIKGLQKLKFYRERNPMLAKNLGKAAEEIAPGSDLNEMNKGTRLKVIMRALDLTLTDDTIKRMSSTFDAIKQTFLTKLWDPNIGMFGLLRDVDNNLENGMQTAFGAITEALDSVIGEKGVLTTLGGLLVALGLDAGDPMVRLRNGMLAFAGWMKDLSGWFQKLTNIINSGGNGREIVVSELLKIPEKIGAWLASMVNAAVSGIGGSGNNVAQIATMAARIIGAIFSGIDTFLRNLSPQSYLAIAAGLLAAGLIPIFGTIIAPILGAIGLATAGVPVLLVIGAAAALIGIASLIAQNWQAIVKTVGDFCNWLGAGIQGFFVQLAAWIMANLAQVSAIVLAVMTGNFTLAGSLFANFFGGFTNNVASALGGLLVQAVTWLKNFVTGIATAISSFFSNLGSQISGGLQQAAGAALSAVPGVGGAMSIAGGAASMIGSVMGGGATGYLPGTGLGGLLAAAMQESRKMPAGSQLMLANSSEAILTGGQQAALMGGGGSAGGRGAFSPQITIAAAPGMDVNALADAVMQRISDAYRQYEMGFLT